jgi:predicted Rossmann fold nucleotide-binding protein DprA/Smf involved in DNA uptake
VGKIQVGLINLIFFIDDILKDLKDMQKKAADFDKLSKKMGNVSPDDMLKELEALRKKAKDADDLKKKCGMDPNDLLKELEKLRKALKDKDKENDDMKRKLNDN